MIIAISGETFESEIAIKRKIQRWTRRLATMPDLERYALTAAIDAMEDAGPHRQEERAAPVIIGANDEGGQHRQDKRVPH